MKKISRRFFSRQQRYWVSQPDLAKEYPLILIAGTKLEMYTHYITDRIGPLAVYFYHGFKESNCTVLTDHKLHIGQCILPGPLRINPRALFPLNIHNEPFPS